MATARAMLGRVWDELKPAVDHGRSEVAAALFAGSAYVMYPRAEPPELAPDEPGRGLSPDAPVDLESLRARAREIEPAREAEPEREDRGGPER